MKGSIPGLERSPGGGHGNPLQHFSTLAWRIPMDRGAWRATVPRVTERHDRIDFTHAHAGTHARTRARTHARTCTIHPFLSCFFPLVPGVPVWGNVVRNSFLLMAD